MVRSWLRFENEKMSKQYDNWERLVVAVLQRQHDRELAMCRSTDSSPFSSGRTSSFTSEFYDYLHDAINNSNAGIFPFSGHRSTSSYFQDEGNGKKSYMVGARDLIISFGNNSKNWKYWRFEDNSRDSSEVAELCSTWRLDIRAKIAAGMLNPLTVYGAYLVYKLAEKAEGLESAKGVIRFMDDESDRDAVKGARVVQLQPVSVGGQRDDGWMEAEMGNFYVGQRDDGQVEARLVEIRKWKCGLIVQGILFRPSSSYTDAPLLSNKYKSTRAWA